MRAVCIGGGPGGLYFGICMKLRNPDHEILVVERNKADDTFGWGVVFSDQTMERLQANDTRSADWILDQFAHWMTLKSIIETISSGREDMGLVD